MVKLPFSAPKSLFPALLNSWFHVRLGSTADCP
jgi:hypothetical protein